LTATVIAAGTLVSVILPVNGLFEKSGTAFGFERVEVPVTTVGEDGQKTVVQERQARFKLFGRVLHSSTPEWSGITSWARWNYTGLEDPDSKSPVCGSENWDSGCVGGWEEFEDFIATMQAIGDDPDHGCGRMFWEYEKDRVNSYGTTMAPMLLPYFTDGCIASQEGLYFESTPSVPIHFIVQSELS